jgi:tRNA(His) guanylyltransferase
MSADLFVLRFDGCGFSRLSKSTFERPHDSRFASAMEAAALTTLKALNGTLVFFGSDEVTVLVEPQRVLYAGREEKLVSVGASFAATAFALASSVSVGLSQPVGFDGRMFRLSASDAAEMLLDRRASVKRNAVSDALHGHKVASSAKLKGVGQTDRYALLEAAGVSMTARQEFGAFACPALAHTGSTVFDATWAVTQSVADFVRTLGGLEPVCAA